MPRLFTALIVLAAPCWAAAQSLHAEAAGQSLAIASPCARSVTITVDPALTGKSVLDATAAHPEELSQLVFTTEKNQATLRTRDNECWRHDEDSDTQQTLQVTLRVPPSFGVSVEDSGEAAYRIGDLHAPLSVDGSGHLHLDAGAVTALNLEVSGSGEITVAQVADAVHAEMSGSATVTIGGGTLQALNIDASGSGHFHYGSGTIAALHVESSGDADVEIGATVGAAAVDLSGAGNVRLARVTGPLAKEETGSGTVQVLGH